MTSPHVCYMCKAAGKTFVCATCNDIQFCDACWGKWVLHSPNTASSSRNSHERVDPVLLKRLRHVFEPIRTEAEHVAELGRDRESTWFGFDRDSAGRPTFVDHGRFASIMTESLVGNATERYPQLVSFIGETGAGKSALIKLLIDRQDLSTQTTARYWSPVTSSTQDYIPTTGDVHLYADPSSFHTTQPVLFVDCEGLNGGEALPKALRRFSIGDSSSSDPVLSSQGDSISTRRAQSPLMSLHSSQRSILWAKTPQTKTREYTIQHLYPKILYTFSDVVIFVTRNPRSFESTVLDKLIDWGATSLDKSLNQPTLPHVIVVLNATDTVDDADWEPKRATEKLMATIEGAIFRDPGLQEYVQAWNNRGKKVTSTKQLLGCYYSSIAVIRMPSRSSYALMSRQAEKLIDLIKTRCAKSHRSKRQARLLANAEQMHIYLQSAFDQFTRDLESPFDFIKESLRQKPVPRTFEGSILRLAICIKENSADKSLRNDARQIFCRLAPMVASCIMFDAARQNLMGTAPQLLGGAYSELCTAALRSFVDDNWPCGFENTAYGSTNGRCSNLKYSHMKGHQNSRGKLIGNGPYQANLDLKALESCWMKVIGDQLALFQNAAYKLGQTILRHDTQIATILHRERMDSFYAGLGNTPSFISNSACFSCLRGLPECILPCGHILCEPCVRNFGREASRISIELTRCPLHVREAFQTKEHTFSFKPPRAGVRILSLDGGGVGALVELYILRAIQKLLGPKLPIRIFFDLVVGTSGGGLIALGLGTQGWSVDEAISKFKAIFKEVFRPHDLNRVPFLEGVTNAFYGSLYKTQTLESVFRREFFDTLLFGSSTNLKLMPKVAVTSSSIFGNQATILANYNRPQDSSQGIGYQFLCLDTPSKEMKVWEAARATFAFPRYFKPFHKVETQRNYIAATNNFACPARVAHQEAHLIWNDIAVEPDIFLSFGTGRNAQAATLPQNHRPPQRPDSIDDITPAGFTRSPLLMHIISKTFLGQAASGIDPERIWEEFITSDLAHNDHRPVGDSHRHIRINPKLTMDAPKIDDVKQIEQLEREVEEVMYQDSTRIKEIAHRLLTSSFFFEKNIDSVRRVGDRYTCSGFICCRFEQSSTEIEGLGDVLYTCLKGDFKPYFLIEEQDHPGSPAFAAILTETVIRNMRRGYFDLGIIKLEVSKEHSSVNISLCLQTVAYASGATSLPISGFPRQLISEDATCVASNINSTLLNDQPSNYDSKPHKPDVNELVLLSRVPKEPMGIVELSETTAPTPELEGGRGLFELGS